MDYRFGLRPLPARGNYVVKLKSKFGLTPKKRTSDADAAGPCKLAPLTFDLLLDPSTNYTPVLIGRHLKDGPCEGIWTVENAASSWYMYGEYYISLDGEQVESVTILKPGDDPGEYPLGIPAGEGFDYDYMIKIKYAYAAHRYLFLAIKNYPEYIEVWALVWRLNVFEPWLASSVTYDLRNEAGEVYSCIINLEIPEGGD
jgi:hypothetical protein